VISQFLGAISLRRAIADEIATAEREERNPSAARVTARVAAVWGILLLWVVGGVATLAISAAMLVHEAKAVLP